MIRYKSILENLKFSDLMRNAGNSALTSKFRKIRNKKIGNEAQNAKLVSATVNREEDWIQFKFVTRKTPYDDPNHKYSRTIPEVGYTIVKDTTNLYEMKIRVLDFFKLLETTPTYPDITDQDIEEVLNNADIKLFCDCLSFQFQGMNYHLSSFDASIFPTTIPDPVWGPKHGNGDGLICKHLQGTVNSIKFFVPQMRQAIKKYIDKGGIK